LPHLLPENTSPTAIWGQGAHVTPLIPLYYFGNENQRTAPFKDLQSTDVTPSVNTNVRSTMKRIMRTVEMIAVDLQISISSENIHQGLPSAEDVIHQLQQAFMHLQQYLSGHPDSRIAAFVASTHTPTSLPSAPSELSDTATEMAKTRAIAASNKLIQQSLLTFSTVYSHIRKRCNASPPDTYLLRAKDDLPPPNAITTIANPAPTPTVAAIRTGGERPTAPKGKTPRQSQAPINSATGASMASTDARPFGDGGMIMIDGRSSAPARPPKRPKLTDTPASCQQEGAPTSHTRRGGGSGDGDGASGGTDGTGAPQGRTLLNVNVQTAIDPREASGVPDGNNSDSNGTQNIADDDVPNASGTNGDTEIADSDSHDSEPTRNAPRPKRRNARSNESRQTPSTSNRPVTSLAITMGTNPDQIRQWEADRLRRQHVLHQTNRTFLPVLRPSPFANHGRGELRTGTTIEWICQTPPDRAEVDEGQH